MTLRRVDVTVFLLETSGGKGNPFLFPRERVLGKMKKAQSNFAESDSGHSIAALYILLMSITLLQ